MVSFIKGWTLLLMCHYIDHFLVDFEVGLCRSEISYLAELLQSQAAEVSPGDASQINVASVLDSSRQKEFGSGISEGNKNDGIESSAIMLNPKNNSKVR